jgi:flavin reductase (DIM6/NTAB) family NADH-FMN oxidoreductase RutF
VTELLSVSRKNPLPKVSDNTILEKTQSSDAIFTERMRTLMRCVPHPAIVITAALHNPELNSTTPQAMTASSFNTISIAPIPTIAFNIHLPSRTWDAIKSLDGHFRIHILKNEGKGATIADAFTKGDAQTGFRKLGPIINLKPEIDGTYGCVPKIEDPSVAAVLDCQLVQQMQVRDHMIMIAEVSNIHWDGEPHDTLMYVSGAFKKIGETLFDRS